MANEITREIGWNVGLSSTGLVLLDLFIAVVVVAVLGYFIARRLPLWKIGKSEQRTDHIGKRLSHVIVNGLMQKALLREPYPGLVHSMLFFGFVALFIGTTIIFIQEYFARPIFNWHFFQGNFYIIYSFVLDLFGVLAVLAVVLFAIRRYVQKPERLDRKPVDALVLLLVFLVLVTGFLVEASRLAINAPEFEKWSFIGWNLAKILPAEAALHRAFWWTHLVFSVGLMLYIVPSSLIHIITAAANLFFAKIDKTTRGAMQPIPTEVFETAESFGVGRLEDFSWKQIFDSDACTRCGRCQDQCPAWLTTKPLSPKKLVQDLKTHWLELGPKILAAGINGNNDNPGTTNGRKTLIGEVFLPAEIWACTNCRACVEACPVGIDQVDMINDLRRHLVMDAGDFPNELQVTLRNMENQGNPWGLGAHQRGDWAKNLEVPLMNVNPGAEYLFYVGCAAAYNPRAEKVAKAFINILKTAGVNFAILGQEEQCCGDTARRAGNEYLFQMMAEMTIETFKRYNVQKIITTCPHGYHTFKKEYPQFGVHYQVFHHTEFIEKLVNEGKLKPDKSQLPGTFTWHDSCFIGRYNDIYQAPRMVLQRAGVSLTEMKRNRNNGFCCGAGGARMWLEEEKDQRVNIARVKEAVATRAENIALSCPYCMTMFEDAIKELETDMKVYDIAEVVESAMSGRQ